MEKFYNSLIFKALKMTKNSSDDGKGYVLAKNCPSRQILEHLTSRWGVLILIVLKQGTKRFSEIRRQIEGISERMLTQSLQQLEQDGMIHRKSYHTMPPRVEYSLTAHGKQAADKVANLVDWLEDNLQDILKNRPDQAV